MHGSRRLKASLSVSGLVLMGVGGVLLVTPSVMHASNGVELGNDPSLLSEVRAPGGALLVLGFLVIAGVFEPRWRYAATLVAGAVYGAYGLSRLFSMAIDGMPAPGLVVAAGLEITIGAVNLALLSRLRPVA